MTGVIVVAVAAALALAFGLYRKAVDGRAREVRAAADLTPRLDAGRIGHPLGQQATFVQFSSPACAPCRSTDVLLTQLTAERPELVHVDLDAPSHLDLVEEFGIMRTPTVLVLDASGAVRQRIVGAPRRPQVLEALDQLTTSAASA